MEELFTRLGLDTKEAAATLELIRLGPSPVSRWAKHAGVNRSSMYVLLERLKEAGLITTFVHNSILHAQAIAVSDLPRLVETRRQQLTDTQAMVASHLSELGKLEKSSVIRPKVKFYEGKTGVARMYEEVLKETSFKSFFHPRRVQEQMKEYFHKIPLTLKARGGKAKELLVPCREAESYKKLYASDTHQIRILPPGVTFSSDTIITKEKIYLVGYSHNEMVATEIWNEALARTQSTLFDLLWSCL